MDTIKLREKTGHMLRGDSLQRDKIEGIKKGGEKGVGPKWRLRRKLLDWMIEKRYRELKRKSTTTKGEEPLDVRTCQWAENLKKKSHSRMIQWYVTSQIFSWCSLDESVLKTFDNMYIYYVASRLFVIVVHLFLPMLSFTKTRARSKSSKCCVIFSQEGMKRTYKRYETWFF